MFFFISARRIARRNASALFVIFFLSAALLFTGCAETDSMADAKVSLNGNWDDGLGYGLVTINSPAKKVMMKDDYEGTIINSPDFTATDGVLIIRFTKYITKVYDLNPPYGVISSTDTPANVGKFGAMYWTGLTPNSVRLSDAYIGLTHTMFNSIGDANNAFLPAADKVGAYVNWTYTSPYTKQ